MSTSKISIKGTIVGIKQLETRRGHSFIRAQVRSDDAVIDVDIFSRADRAKFDIAMPGDKISASGAGYHRGTLCSGKTSITAERVTIRRDDAARAAYRKPQQMNLFAA